jgi:hypothetical protein
LAQAEFNPLFKPAAVNPGNGALVNTRGDLIELHYDFYDRFYVGILCCTAHSPKIIEDPDACNEQ